MMTWEDRADSLRSKRESDGRDSWPAGEQRPCVAFRQGTDVKPIAGGFPLGEPWGLDDPGLPEHLRLDTFLPRPEVNQPLEPEPSPRMRAGVSVDGAGWYIRIGDHEYGITADGLDVQRDVKTGRIRVLYSPRQRQEATEYARQFGAAHASRKFGIPRKTVAYWLTHGVDDSE